MKAEGYKHSTFRINRQATIEEELKDIKARSQFGRAMDDLTIELIFAHSPQAKGRVERLFETLQDIPLCFQIAKSIIPNEAIITLRLYFYISPIPI